MLNDIFELLEPLTRVPNEELRTLAREARMVMTARLASTSSTFDGKSSSADAPDPQETYQKALKLLQDPLLPVRAHGLLLLRQLVAPAPGLSAPALDRALVPGILAIFLQVAESPRVPNCTAARDPAAACNSSSACNSPAKRRRRSLNWRWYVWALTRLSTPQPVSIGHRH